MKLYRWLPPWRKSQFKPESSWVRSALKYAPMGIRTDPVALPLLLSTDPADRSASSGLLLLEFQRHHTLAQRTKTFMMHRKIWDNRLLFHRKDFQMYFNLGQWFDFHVFPFTKGQLLNCSIPLTLRSGKNPKLQSTMTVKNLCYHVFQ